MELLLGLPRAVVSQSKPVHFLLLSLLGGLVLVLSQISSGCLSIGSSFRDNSVFKAISNKIWAIFMCAFACEKGKDRIDEMKLKN